MCVLYQTFLVTWQKIRNGLRSPALIFSNLKDTDKNMVKALRNSVMLNTHVFSIWKVTLQI